MSNPLFLIVLLPSAKQKLEEMNQLDGLVGKLRAVPNIRLYNLPHEENKKRIAVALSFGDGKVLLLKKDDSENNRDYFICTGVTELKKPPTASAYYHELPGNVEIRIEHIGKIDCYLEDAVDCGEIDREVKDRKPWEPHKGAAPEEKKWKAYLDLFENMLNGKRFGFPVNKLELRGKSAVISFDFSGIPDIDESEINKKIEKARGESVRFSLTPDAIESPKKYYYNKGKFGKLKAFDGGDITIELDKDFNSEIKTQIKQGEFYVRDSAIVHESNASGNGENHIRFIRMGKFLESVKPENNGKDNAADGDSGADEKDESGATLPFEYAKSDGQRETNFYYDEGGENLAFSCRAERKESNWQIDPDSIKPHQIMVFADFVGDFYQVKVMKRGMKEIKENSIWEVLAGERVAKLPMEKNIEWEEGCRLNDRQKEAVKKALGAPELCLIWGPPGTGKTEVISEIARREAQQGHKVLISSQANLAVDNALARLHGADDVWTFRQIKDKHDLEEEDKMKVPTWKTAHRFFVQWLEKRIASSDNADSAIADLRKKLVNRLKRKAWNEKDAEQMAALYRRRINVVGATLIETGKWNRDAGKNNLLHITGVAEFDTVIIDEVSKALPPELFLPILLGKRVVLVGDYKQLPPTFKMSNGDDLALDKWAEMAGVPVSEVDTDTTIFERLWNRHDKDAAGVRAMLTKQYRMHPRIQKLIERFYAESEGRLECGLSDVEQRKMAITHEGCFAGRHAVWVDTENDALENRAGTSYANNDEIIIVGKILEQLPDNKQISVGVITFYGAQLRKLRDRYEQKYAGKFPNGKLIFGTVDRFQGRECDVIICSLVRKNKHGNIGFAVKANRINVAFSRARKLLCIVGNSGHFCYESKKQDAREIYKKIYQNCHRLTKGEING